MIHKYTHPYMCPALVVLNGKKYLLPEWKEVSLSTTLDDIVWIKSKNINNE
tara:strand:+ start:963 stop:1115 length:153 start_codon:yes stop_codon:yes gene_type:complete